MRLTPELEAQLPGRQQLCVGLGRVTAGRRQLFKQQQGLAVEMVQRAFEVTPCNGEDRLASVNCQPVAAQPDRASTGQWQRPGGHCLPSAPYITTRCRCQ